MFASIEYISGLMHLLLILSGIIIVAAMMFSNLIISFPRLCLRFAAFLFDTVGATVVEILMKILRSSVLEFLFNLTFNQLDKCSRNVRSVGFILIASLACVLLLVALQGASLEGIIILITFLLLAIDKIFAIKRTKLLLKEAKQFKKAAINASQRGHWYDTLVHFDKALDIYKQPLLVKNPSLDVERANLLEKIAGVLEKNNQIDKALLRLHQALDVYRKPRFAEDSVVKKYRVRALKETAKILYESGRRKQAKKRYELISELVGKPVSYFSE